MARQQQIGLFSSLTPTGVDQTAGSSLKVLAGLSEGISQLAFREVGKQQQKRGKVEGALSVQRDEEGNVIAPEEKSDFTIFGQAFNQSAILANRAQIGIDTKESLDRIQNQHKLDPEAFKNASAGARQGLLQGMPDELAAIVGLDFDSSVSSRLSTLNKDMFRRETEQQKATFRAGVESATDDLLNATRTGDTQRQQDLLLENNASIDEAVQAGLMSPIEAEAIKERTLERITQQEALRQVDEIVFSEDLTLEEQAKKGTDFVETLRASKLEDLSPEQKDSLLAVVERRVGDIFQNIRAQRNQRDLEKEKVVSNLKISASMAQESAKDGELTDLTSLTEQMEQLHNNGDISESERTSIGTKIAKTAEVIDDIMLADKRILARLSGDDSILMNKQDVDSFYKRKLADDIETLDPATANVANAQFISQTRSVPTQVKNQITSNILSGDPELIKQSADLVDRIDEIPGMVDLVVDASQRSFIDHVVALSDSLEPEQAIKLARELTDPRDSARIEAREQTIKTEKLREDYRDDVDDAFSQFFGNDLTDNVNLQEVTREYSVLFESFFKAGMDESAAKEKSIELLQRNWKDSDFGFMKHPPETYYNVSGDTDYIKSQLVSDLKAGIVGLEINQDNVFLLSDETTDRQAGQGQPSYRIMVQGEGGELQFPTLTDENGNPSNRWMPDVAIERERQLRENEELVKAGRKSRVRRKDLELPSLGTFFSLDPIKESTGKRPKKEKKPVKPSVSGSASDIQKSLFNIGQL